MRIKFQSKRTRDLFFESIKSKVGLWKNFYELFDISRKTFDAYKSGRSTLPQDFFDKMCNHFKLAEENTEKIEDDWGRRKGGIEAYKKNKYYFDEGRKKLLNNIKNRKPQFDINLSLSSDIAYFIGLFIGDGFSNKYANSYQIQFTGHISEFEYYTNIIFPIVKNNFNIGARLKRDKYAENALRFNINSKDLYLFITQRLRIPPGRKSYSVLIPKEIEESPSVLDCIAGIFDAEGCFYIDNRKRYKNGYPRVDLHMNNPGIIKQISEIFIKNNINHSVSKNCGNILIYGNKNVIDFYKKIPLKNPKIKNGLDNLMAV